MIQWSATGRIWSGLVRPIPKFSLLSRLKPNTPVIIDFGNICSANTPCLYTIQNEYIGYMTQDVGVEAIERYKLGELVLCKVLTPAMNLKVGIKNDFIKPTILVWSEIPEAECLVENSKISCESRS